MAKYLFPPLAPSTVPIVDREELYPVHRIFCVGRNYVEHAKEMGHEVDRTAPFYFLKPATAIVNSGSEIPYPPGTADYHHEIELVVAIGAPAFQISADRSADAIFGFAVGLDMTRRDLQQAARVKGRPWDLGKAVEQSAIIGSITPAERFGDIGPQEIRLEVDGRIRQKATLADLVWSVNELVADLSKFYHLTPGDLIYTGTPAGVGPVEPGNRLTGGIEGLATLVVTIGPPETRS